MLLLQRTLDIPEPETDVRAEIDSSERQARFLDRTDRRPADVNDRFDVTVAALVFGTVGQFYRPDEGRDGPVGW